jgi:hypothetical protein
MRNFDFFFMLSLVLTEISISAIYLIILFNIFESDSFNESQKENYLVELLESALSICFNCISIWILICLGMHSLYFKIIHRLFWYIIW